MANLSREQWAGAWCVAVLVLSIGALAAGAGITVTNGVVMLVALLTPPSIMFLIWHPPPQTVAEVLYDASADAKGDPR